MKDFEGYKEGLGKVVEVSGYSRFFTHSYICTSVSPLTLTSPLVGVSQPVNVMFQKMSMPLPQGVFGLTHPLPIPLEIPGLVHTFL